MVDIRACGRTDVGRARTHNEDCFDIDEASRLYLVADGMGGHRYGEVASRVAVAAIREFVRERLAGDDTWPFALDAGLQRHSNLLRNAVREAHRKVLSAIQKDHRLYGMGTTLVGFYLDGDVAAIAHVGDSRAYRLRGGVLELLTQDHTWVNEQVVAGFLSEEQARIHPLKNVVTRALGGERDVAVDVREIQVRPGDLYLLCSDGLTTMLADSEIAALTHDAAVASQAPENQAPENQVPESQAQENQPLETLCDRLVACANHRGGHDNVTVVALAIS